MKLSSCDQVLVETLSDTKIVSTDPMVASVERRPRGYLVKSMAPGTCLLNYFYCGLLYNSVLVEVVPAIPPAYQEVN